MFTPTFDSFTLKFKYFSVPRGNQSLPNIGGKRNLKKEANRGQTENVSTFLVHSSGKRIKSFLSNVKVFSGFQDKRIFVPDFLTP